MNRIALHGFLGLPSDWKSLQSAHSVDLFSESPIPYWDWAQSFNKKHSGTLVGYSLGGRLALHALIDDPSRWERAIIVSAHPGLHVDKRPVRLVEDALWAEKFVHAPWDDLMNQWNRRDVFAHDNPAVRIESNFNRQNLSRALRVWSLGNQERLHEKISRLPMQITWIVGEKDLRFVSEAKSLSFVHPKSELIILPHKGHRIPLDLVAKISFGE